MRPITSSLLPALLLALPLLFMAGCSQPPALSPREATVILTEQSRSGSAEDAYSLYGCSAERTYAIAFASVTPPMGLQRLRELRGESYTPATPTPIRTPAPPTPTPTAQELACVKIYNAAQVQTAAIRGAAKWKDTWLATYDGDGWWIIDTRTAGLWLLSEKQQTVIPCDPLAAGEKRFRQDHREALDNLKRCTS
ncbi:MAG: hypothetical protein Q7K03_01490 [Dehalococcoidia bacterium]|nr:hypothetical protein [Dehalococcoidia bacterium]